MAWINKALAQVAEQAEPINLSIKIGNVSSVRDYADYIAQFFTFAIGASAVLVAFMITLAGFQWVASGGESGAVTAAKKRINNSVIGMILLLSSYVILSAINPDLVNLRVPVIQRIQNVPLIGDMCPNEGSYANRFPCGEVIKGDQIGRSPGYTCMGQACPGGGTCAFTGRDTASTGANKPTLTYACIDPALCQAATRCDQFTPPLTPGTPFPYGDKWKQYCEGADTMCANFVGQDRVGCYVSENFCRPKKAVGQSCDSDEPCAAGLICDTAGLTSTCRYPQNLPEGANCDRDDVCASNTCNKNLEPIGPGDGKCAPINGYKKEEDCELGGVSGRNNMCGEGWQCLDFGTVQDPTCSDLQEGSVCINACASTDLECVNTIPGTTKRCRKKDAQPPSEARRSAF